MPWPSRYTRDTRFSAGKISRLAMQFAQLQDWLCLALAFSCHTSSDTVLTYR